jgi:hypothetical protein
MTYTELKCIQQEIYRLRAKRADLRESAEKITQTLSDMPTGVGTSDKIGEAIIKIQTLNERIDFLNDRFCSALNSLPESLEAHCIVLRIKRQYSWVKIAHIVGGGNTADGVRMKVNRYQW